MVTAMNDSAASVTHSGTRRDVVPDARFNPGGNANYSLSQPAHFCLNAPLAEREYARVSGTRGSGFESRVGYHFFQAFPRCSAAGKRASFGTMRPQVRALPARPLPVTARNSMDESS